VLLEEIARIEDAIDERSLLQQTVVPYAQWAETALLGDGNRRALVGRSGPAGKGDGARWLFYRPDVEHVIGRGFLEPEVLRDRLASTPSWRGALHPDPRPALRSFRRQLAARGIELLVVPTPVKPTIEPERLTGRPLPTAGGPGRALPLHNPSFEGFVHELESGAAADRVAVFDPAPLLVDPIPGQPPAEAQPEAMADSADRYLRTDTHWTPEAMDRVARALAAEVTEQLGPPAEPVAYQRQPVSVAGVGDVAQMLRLPAAAALFPTQEVTTRLVTGPGGEPWRPEPGSEVLLLGDSFTNVFSQDALGWGRGSGLAEQLAYHLGRPVDRIAVNAGGAHTTREALARALRDDPGRLDGVRLVIYQFASRELSHGDWRPVELPARVVPAASRAELPARDAPVASRAGAAAAGSAVPERPFRLGDGFVVWESNRSGAWRIWTARLDGTGVRRLSADEPGMQHCCAHISPDGTRLVYLSRAAPADRYPKVEVPGELRLVALGSPGGPGGPGGDALPTLGQVIASSARTYGWGDRSAVWRSDRELIHVAGDGHTEMLELAGDRVVRQRALTTEPRETLGWLIDATLRHATSAAPTFSVYDGAGRRVLERRDLGGCEPYFSHDGRWGFWVPGAGGPIDRIDLVTRETSTILRKNDPRLGAKGYLYFPMLSRDGRLLAFGASAGEHSHFEADYDIFVVPTDPESLAVVGPPVRITTDPATDRYPDVFLARASPELEAARARPPAVRQEGTVEVAEQGWPVTQDGLVFLWRTGDSPNLVPDRILDQIRGRPEEPGGEGLRRAYSLEPIGRARLDHFYRMVLERGAFVAPPEAAQNLLEAAKGTNELTIEATLTPAAAGSGPDGELQRIVTFSTGPTKRNFTLGQQGNRLVARIRTGETGDNADRPEVPLFEVEPGIPVHVAVTYTPGRLVAYRDGEPVVESTAVRGSFSAHWRFRRLLFGREWQDGGDWAGTLEGVALYARALAPEVVRASAERYRAIRAAREEVPQLRVRARLEAASEIPTLRQISPYRRALAVFRYRVLRGPADGPSGEVQVARWVILDGATQPEASLSPGSLEILTLERFADNPQLGDVYLSDTVATGRAGAPEGALYYAVAARGGTR